MAIVKATYSLQILPVGQLLLEDGDEFELEDGDTLRLEEAEWSSSLWSDVERTPITIRRGITNPMDRIASIGAMTLKLRNYENKYSPDHASAMEGFDQGTEMRLVATYGGTDYELLRGKIVDILPDPRPTKRVASIVVYDDVDILVREKLKRLALQTDQRSDQLVSAVANNAYTPTAESYATGQDTFAFANDTWRDEQTTAWQALKDIVLSEWGTIWMAGDGTLTFKDRHDRPKHLTVDLSIADKKWVEMDPSRAREDMATIVEVTVTPRVVGGVGSVLWTLEDVPSLDPGQSATYTARYTDPNQEAARVGAQDVISPAQTTDYTMNSQADGGGDDLSGDFTVTPTKGGNATSLLVTNGGTVTGYITKLQIRGTPLLTYQTVVMREESDSQHLADYGPLELMLDMPIQDDPAVGASLARYLRLQYEDPMTRVKGITILANRNATYMTAALGLDVNDRIEITDTELGLSAEAFFVESIQHRISHGGAIHLTTFGLSPASRNQMWVLGIAGASELGETTYWGY